MSPIESNLQHIRADIDRVIAGLPIDSQRPVTLVAVSKTRPADSVREAFAAGQRAFGENYAQEGTAKIEALTDLKPMGIEWHFIGPLQSNKVGLVARHFDWVHGVDRLKIAEGLSRHRADRPINVCVQVNASGELSKGGVSPEDAIGLARACLGLPGLRFRGLMTIIENTVDASAQRHQFRMMRELRDQLLGTGIPVDTLSMGMSQDYRIAIEEGATMVRIGSAIFGARN
jgi:hypothetical protein